MKKHYDAACDWGDFKKKKLVVYYQHNNNEAFIHLTDNLASSISYLKNLGINSLVIENTFESFDLRNRVNILDVATEHNFKIGVIPTTQTERYRREKYGSESKGDELDAKCIFELANDTNCFVAPAKYPSDQQLKKQEERRATFEGRALTCRSLGWPENETKEFTNYFPKDVPDWIKDTHFWEASPIKRDPNRGWLKECWCVPIIAAALQIVADGGDRDDFDRKIGANAMGYPSFLRSNFHFHIVQPEVKHKLGVKKTSQFSDLSQEQVKRTRKEQLTLHRKATRWLFHKVKEQVVAEKTMIER